jgi:hypothetical protein
LRPSERTQPIFDGLGLGIRKIIIKLVGSPFYFLKNTFDGISIAVRFMAVMHTQFMQSGV